MEVNEKPNQVLKKKMSNVLKVGRIIHWVTFNPGGASSCEVHRDPVSRFDDDVVLVPGSLSLIFDLTVSTEANNFLLNNVLRALVDRLTVEFTEEIIQDTDGYDLFKPYEDLFLTVSERTDMFRELI